MPQIAAAQAPQSRANFKTLLSSSRLDATGGS